MFRFLLEKYKKWRLNKRNVQTLEDIKKAKQCYVDGIEKFMCLCFERVDHEKYCDYESIHRLIPEFNRENLGAVLGDTSSVWWYSFDIDSRINAFNKLIEIYTLKIEKK